MKILLVEDDERLRANIAKALQLEGFETAQAADGEQGLYELENNSCDLVILDRMLPRMEGLALLRRARDTGVRTPVLMLTAMNDVGDKVDGLDAGADDYLTKPFDMRELLARVRALARRPAEIEPDEELRYGDLRLSTTGLTLSGPAGSLPLSKREGELLALFLRSGGQALTRATIFSRVWGPAAEVEEGNIDTYIHFLRRRLRETGNEVRLVNHRGVGYSLEYTPGEEAEACSQS